MLRKFVNSIWIIQRGCSTAARNASAGNVQEKKKVFHGMAKHEEHAKQYEELLNEETAAYEEGVRYLAYMMGKNPENFSKDDIQEAVGYLFPSSLYNRSARPIFSPPSEIIPKQKSLQCSADGRPYESLYYTRYPNFYKIMNEAALTLNKLARMEDEKVRSGSVIHREKEAWQMKKSSTFWQEVGFLKSLTLEPISPSQYQQFLKLMERILQHPFSYAEEDFIMRFRKAKLTEVKSIELPKLEVDEATGRKFATSYGQRKTAFAEVRVFNPGVGKLTVNEGRFLEAFPLLSNREQVITPLVFTRMLGEVDVELTVSGGGETSRSGAARLAIARALSCFLEESDVHRLRLAGLLTMDMRFREKKKSGMPKARRTYIWKRR